MLPLPLALAGCVLITKPPCEVTTDVDIPIDDYWSGRLDVDPDTCSRELTLQFQRADRWTVSAIAQNGPVSISGQSQTCGDSPWDFSTVPLDHPQGEDGFDLSRVTVQSEKGDLAHLVVTSCGPFDLSVRPDTCGDLPVFDTTGALAIESCENLTSASCGTTAANGTDAAFLWTAPEDGTWSFATDTAYALELRAPCDEAALACAPSGVAPSTTVTWDLRSGESVAIFVHGAESECIEAEVRIADAGGTDTGLDSGWVCVENISARGSATLNGDSCQGDDFSTMCGGEGVEDQSILWTAPTSGTWAFELTTSDPAFDTLLELREPCPDASPLECVEGSGAVLTREVEAGDELLMVVSGSNPGDCGPYELRIWSPDDGDTGPDDTGLATTADTGPADTGAALDDTATTSDTASCPVDQFGFNHTLQTAADLPGGLYTDLTLESEFDWYELQIPANTTCEVQPIPLTVDLQKWDASGTPTSQPLAAFSIYSSSATTELFTVSSSGGGVCVPYSLDVTCTPCVEDAYEPNDDASSAATLPPGTHSLYAADADWFAIDVLAGQSVVVRTPDIFNVAALRLYAADQTLLVQDTTWPLRVTAGAAAANTTLLVEVEGYGSPCPIYDLIVQVTP